jgi:hypothetical protein
VRARTAISRSCAVPLTVINPCTTVVAECSTPYKKKLGKLSVNPDTQVYLAPKPAHLLPHFVALPLATMVLDIIFAVSYCGLLCAECFAHINSGT